MKALLIVDIQNDFCPGGSLPVKDGDAVVQPANRLIESFTAAGLPIVFTRDWHPANHCSFSDFGGIWPVHCVSDTGGAAFHEELLIPGNAIIISKADKIDKDAYSGFEGTRLDESLKNLEVDELVIAGLATDYCVKNTVSDALGFGYAVTVAVEGIKAVNVQNGDGDDAIELMRTRGAVFKSCERILTGITAE